MLAKVPERRGFDAPETASEIHAINVELENLRFRVTVLDAGGKNDFLKLAPERFLAGQKAGARQLLREGARALRRAAAGDVRKGRLGNAGGIHGAMRVEALILDGEQRANEVRRHLGQRDIDAFFSRERRGGRIGGVEDDRRLGRVADVADGRVARQIAGEVVPPPHARADRHRSGKDRGLPQRRKREGPERHGPVRT